jgi:uncharacterized membrane protein YczE
MSGHVRGLLRLRPARRTADGPSITVAHPRTRSVLGFHFLAFAAPRARRATQLVIGLALFGVSVAWTVEAALGASPWTVFHEGASARLGISFGTTVSLTGLVIVGLLRVLHEPLGLGTVLNVAIIGPVADLTLWAIPDLDALWIRVGLLAAAPVLLALGSGLYLGAGVGPGPRDGVMTALQRRGIATWKARTSIELTALAVGFALGGVVGLGTVWMAVAIGPCVQLFLPWFRIDPA